ncbi:MAG: glycosyltransferase family 39 protein [Gammaproteobacteria bacterium]|nr:glycosyltransferase family 39 protein [Gammaproteobacteria bacterium]
MLSKATPLHQPDSLGLSITTSRKTWWQDILVLTLAFAVLFGAFLGTRPLTVPDEGRYAEIPREMVSTGDYTTPRINGVKYFEKPPFFYWMQAASYHAFGINEWSIRIPNALMGLLGVLLVYCTARKLYSRRTGLLSAMLLGTFGLYSTMAHMVTLDMSLSVFLTATFCCFILGNQHPAGAQRSRYMWAMYFFAALATLTKGLIGIIFPCMIIFTWILLTGQWREIKTYCIPRGFLLLAIITAPWHILVQLKNPEFFNYYFIDQQFLRYFTDAQKRSQSFWFLPAVLLGGMFPWTGLIIPAISHAFREVSKTSLFLFVWSVLIFLFFWISKSQLIPYVLPIYFPLSMLLGHYVEWSLDNPKHWGVRVSLAITALLSILTLIIGSFALNFSHPSLYVTSGLLIFSMIVTLIAAWKSTWLTTLITLSLSTSLFFMSFNFSYPPTDTRSIKDLAVVLKPLLNKNDTVYSYHNHFQDLPVYLGRRVIMVDFYGEIWFGLEHTDLTGIWMNDKEFWSSWSKPERQFMIMSLDEYHSVVKNHPEQLHEISHNENNVLVSNIQPGKNSHSTNSLTRS